MPRWGEGQQSLQAPDVVKYEQINNCPRLAVMLVFTVARVTKLQKSLSQGVRLKICSMLTYCFLAGNYIDYRQEPITYRIFLHDILYKEKIDDVGYLPFLTNKSIQRPRGTRSTEHGDRLWSRAANFEPGFLFDREENIAKHKQNRCRSIH